MGRQLVKQPPSMLDRRCHAAVEKPNTQFERKTARIEHSILGQHLRCRLVRVATCLRQVDLKFDLEMCR